MRRISMQAGGDQPSSLWRNREFLLLWSGQGVSALGTALSDFVLPFLVLALTHSAAQAGAISAMRILAYVVCGLSAGALVDRWDRKRVMIVCDLLRLTAMGSAPCAAWLGCLSIGQLYAVALLEGTCFVFFANAQAGALPQVVPTAHLPRAYSLNMATSSGAFFLGPLLGGVLVGISASGRDGSLRAYALDSASYAVSAISLLWIRVPFHLERTTPSARLRDSIQEGVRYLWGHAHLRALLLLSAATNTLGGFLSLAILVLANQNLHAGSRTIGLMFSVVSLGGIAGSLVAPALTRRVPLGWLIIGATAGQASAVAGEAAAPSVTVLGTAAFIVFLLLSLLAVATAAYRTSLIPDVLRGRVNSVYAVVLTAGLPISMALGGLALPWSGPRAELAFGAAAWLCCALGALRSSLRTVRGL